MILDHGGGKGLFVSIAPLLRELTGLDLKHVADGGCFTKSSVAGLMPSVELIPVFSPMDRAISGCREQHERKARGKILHFDIPLSVAGLAPAADVSISDTPDRSLALAASISWRARPGFTRGNYPLPKAVARFDPEASCEGSDKLQAGPGYFSGAARSLPLECPASVGPQPNAVGKPSAWTDRSEKRICECAKCGLK